MKRLVKSWAAAAGYRISRGWLPNRFQAMPETLELLRRRGYAPRVLLDGGANVGAWTRTARRIFPEASSHLFEPQLGCRAALERLAKELPRVTVHACALAAPGTTSVRMTDAVGTGTGAAVIDGAAEGHEIPAATLDDLVAAGLTPGDRALLKLDLEGYEVEALRGAARTLAVAEVVLAEAQFFRVEGADRPVFMELADRLRDAGFELHDFASLSGRPRDGRLVQCDAVFVQRHSPLRADVAWE